MITDLWFHFYSFLIPEQAYQRPVNYKGSIKFERILSTPTVFAHGK